MVFCSYESLSSPLLIFRLYCSLQPVWFITWINNSTTERTNTTTTRFSEFLVALCELTLFPKYCHVKVFSSKTKSDAFSSWNVVPLRPYKAFLISRRFVRWACDSYSPPDSVGSSSSGTFWISGVWSLEATGRKFLQIPHWCDTAEKGN